MAQFSNHLKILLTKPTTRIQEAKLVERPRHVRRSVRKREVGVVQASQPHFITETRFKSRDYVQGKETSPIKKKPSAHYRCFHKNTFIERSGTSTILGDSLERRNPSAFNNYLRKYSSRHCLQNLCPQLV